MASPIVLTLRPVSFRKCSISGAVVHLLSGKDDVVLLNMVSSNARVLNSRRVSLQTGSTSINIADLVNIPSGTYALQVVSSGSYRQLGVVRFVKIKRSME